MVTLIELNVHIALIFDDKGVYIGKKRVDFKSNNFNFMKRTYIFNPLKSSYFPINSSPFPTILKHTKYYFYNINSPEPLIIKKDYNPVLSSEEYGIMIQTDVLKKLNNLANGNWLGNLLTPRNIIIFLVLLGILYYFYSKGGKLT